MRSVRSIVLISFVCLLLLGFSEQGLKGAPIELSSGRQVSFERPGIYKFTKSDDTLLLLSYLTLEPLYQGTKPNEAQERQLISETDEICRYYANPYVQRYMQQFASQDFASMAIRIRYQVGEKNGLKSFVNWTTVYHLNGMTCGEQLKSS